MDFRIDKISCETDDTNSVDMFCFDSNEGGTYYVKVYIYIGNGSSFYPEMNTIYIDHYKGTDEDERYFKHCILNYVISKEESIMNRCVKLSENYVGEKISHEVKRK
jgi:hypothetical protein